MTRPMVASIAEPRGPNRGVSRSYRGPNHVAAYGIALCVFGGLFLVIPAASPWIFAMLAFLVPQFRTKLFPALATVFALATLVAAQEISGDTANYVRAFQALSQSGEVLASAYRWTTSVEPVFWYVTYWINILAGDNYRITLFFLAFISIGATALGFRLISRDAFPLAFALFTSAIYFHYGFGNSVRQGAAIGLLAVALGCLCQQRNRMSLCFSLLATGCHITAFIAIPFFAITVTSRKKILVIFSVLGALSLVLMASYELWADLAVSLSPVVMENKMTKYFGDPDLMETMLSFNSIRMLFFVLLVILVLRSDLLRETNFGYVAAFAIYVFMAQVAVSGSDVLYDRLALYRMPAEFLAYGLILTKIRRIWTLQVLILLGIPMYAIASGMVALGVESYWRHVDQTLFSALAVLIS